MAYFPALGNHYWSQAAWFIDPQNVSGVANDHNTGIDALHPVLSFNGGVIAKLGTTQPTLRQDTTFTWMSNALAGGGDPVVFSPIIVNSYCILRGVMGAAQLVHAGVLAGVVSKNRATGQLLNADLGFAAPISAFVKNTTPGKVSFAWTYINTAGTTFALSQPLVPATFPNILSSTPTEVDTWANGDTFEIYELVEVDLVRFSTVIAEYSAGAGFPDNGVVYQLRSVCAGGAAGDDTVSIGNDIAVAETTFDSSFSRVPVTDAQPTVVYNCFASAGVFTDPGRGAAQIDMYGGVLLSLFGSLICWNLSRDVIVDSTVAFTNFSSAFGSQEQHQTFGAVYFAGIPNSFGGSVMEVIGPTWGPGTIDITGACRVFYASGAGAAAATFLNAGGLLLNSQTVANAFTPATGVWAGTRAITAANLDATIVGGGFAGLALNLGGASITNQDTA